MASRIVGVSCVAAECLATFPPLAAQAIQLKGNNDAKSGLPTPILESGIHVQIFTTVYVPAKDYAALTGSQGHFPHPEPSGQNPRGRDDWRSGGSAGAAVEEGTNAVLGLKSSSPRITRTGNHRTTGGYFRDTLVLCSAKHSQWGYGPESAQLCGQSHAYKIGSCRSFKSY